MGATANQPALTDAKLIGGDPQEDVDRDGTVVETATSVSDAVSVSDAPAGKVTPVTAIIAALIDDQSVANLLM